VQVYLPVALFPLSLFVVAYVVRHHPTFFFFFITLKPRVE
jgi:hypothetical protein